MGTSLKILFLPKKRQGDFVFCISMPFFGCHLALVHLALLLLLEKGTFSVSETTLSGTYFRICGGNDPCLWLLRWLHFVGPSPKGVCDDVEEVRNKRATRQSETWSLKTVIVNTPKQLLPQNFKWRNRTMTKKLQQNKKNAKSANICQNTI